MKYKDALKRANDLIIRLGIRKFCKEKCKGRCCNGAMGRCEGVCTESLPCAIYVCGYIYKSFTGSLYSKLAYLNAYGHFFDQGNIGLKVNPRDHKVTEKEMNQQVWLQLPRFTAAEILRCNKKLESLPALSN